jgi:hypothetical protein
MNVFVTDRIGRHLRMESFALGSRPREWFDAFDTVDATSHG